jgi:uncharacterized heparinase superfamily protein
MGVPARVAGAWGRWWRTVRPLRREQWFGRLWWHLHRPSPRLDPAPSPRVVPGGWSGCAREPSLVAPDRLRVLNLEHALAAPSDWTASDRPMLWRYNAHYFDDLVADGAAARRDWHRTLVQRWIAENPPGRGIGWDPYPTSLRIVNWVAWLWAEGARPDAQDPIVHSLAIQARWLARRLEWHLLGNHLWANAKALVFAGAFFGGVEGDRWRRRGLTLVERELAEQVLADGGHFERSPMYHAILVADLLDLVQLADRVPGIVEPATRAQWATKARAMLDWLGAMSHPDGGPAFFNDTAGGVAPTLGALRAHAASLGIDGGLVPGEPCRLLAASGFARLASGAAVVFADVGSVGPAYLPGHAHAGTLAFECSLGRQRVIVNGGISTYAAGEERLAQRGTASHSTLQVGDADSSEVWAAFRVGRRASVTSRDGGADGQGAWLEAVHDGFTFLRGRPRHRRCWRLEHDRLVVEDALLDAVGAIVDVPGMPVRARFHLHPGWTLRCDSETTGRIHRQDLTLRWKVSGGRATRLAGVWHPGFNLSEPADTLCIELRGGSLRTEFAWEV